MSSTPWIESVPQRLAAQKWLDDYEGTVWWDGTNRRGTSKSMWWNGSSQLPATRKGWWNGSSVQPFV